MCLAVQADPDSKTGASTRLRSHPRRPGECRYLGISWVVYSGHKTNDLCFGFAPASRWNLTGDYGSHDATQFLPLTAATDSIRGGHIRYAPEFGETFAAST